MKELSYCVDFLDPAQLASEEAIFHVANGYLGVRGCFEEGYSAKAKVRSVRGCYINGYYDTVNIEYNERLCGFPQNKQTILNLPDSQTIRLSMNGEIVSAFAGEDYSRTLDMSDGNSCRSYTYKTADGSIHVSMERIASFIRSSLFVIKYTIESDDFNGNLHMESVLNGDVTNFSDPEDPRMAQESVCHPILTYCGIERDMLLMRLHPAHNNNEAACGVLHHCSKCKVQYRKENASLTALFDIHIKPGEKWTLLKYCAYADSRCGKAEETVRNTLLNAKKDGWKRIKEEQRSYLDAFWTRSRVRVTNASLQSSLDFCLYSMLCAAGRDGLSAIAAKGLSGEGYEGHYFWDCETYIFPFFLWSMPKIAGKLLDYRYEKLPQAREHARVLGHQRGALYPWRTIAGSECSSHYPTGSAQYHINADIAHAMAQYWLCTHDEKRLPHIVETLVETARLWIDTGHYFDGSFRIDGVTGPDEYTIMVNNNYYTNAGAKQNLYYAAKLYRTLKERGLAADLENRLGVTESELMEFEEAAAHMLLPMDEKLGICMQDDSFLKKKRIKKERIPPQAFPLLLHYHPLYINRYQICKQADAVLALYNFEETDASAMQRTFDYYESITTGDSSLSACVYGIMAARLGNMGKAYSYFEKAAASDLSDTHGNTADGLHIANMGGVYMCMTAGFGGVRLGEEGLSLFPVVPQAWKHIHFSLRYDNCLLETDADEYGCSLCLREGNELRIKVYGCNVLVTSEAIHVQRPVAGVIFDLDGVVTDTAKYHYAAWKRLADEMGIPFNERANRRFKGVSRQACLDMLLEDGHRHMEETEKKQMLLKKNNYYVELLQTLTEADILPGIKESLQIIKEKGVPAVLFSVSRNTRLILSKIGLSDAFSAVVSGEDIEKSKPDPEGYLLAAQRVGVDFRLCMMIEDAEAGILGAKQLGMRTMGIGVENAEICLQSTAEIPVLMREMLERFHFMQSWHN